MGPFLEQVGLLFLFYFVHRCCGKHQTVPYWCTYHPFFLQARLFAFFKGWLRCLSLRYSQSAIPSFIHLKSFLFKPWRRLCCGPSDVYAETCGVTSVPSAFSQSGRAQNSRFSRFWNGHNSELRPWSLCLPVFEGSCFYWNGVYMVSRDVPVSLLSVMACCRTCNNVYSGGQCFHVHSLFVLHLRG